MITAQLATIPGREESLRLTVNSLLSQVDELIITWNGFDFAVGGFLEKNVCNRHTDNSGGDGEKFWGSDLKKGYVLTCDDDLIYPPDYVETMIKSVDKYNGKALISLHGRELVSGKIDSYYASGNRLQAFHCLGEVTQDHKIINGSVGTGVLAWDADKIRIKYEWFKTPNMADIWLAVNAKKLNIPMIVVKHSRNWLKLGYDGENTIFNKHYNNDSLQTKIWNESQHNNPV